MSSTLLIIALYRKPTRPALQSEFKTMDKPQVCNLAAMLAACMDEGAIANAKVAVWNLCGPMQQEIDGILEDRATCKSTEVLKVCGS